MKLRRLTVFVVAVFLSSRLSPAVAADFTDQLPPHPRLFAHGTTWDALREQVKPDPVSAQLCAAVLARAEVILEKPDVVYQKEGFRLLTPVRQGLIPICDQAEFNSNGILPPTR